MEASEALAAMRLDDTIAKAASSTAAELAAARRDYATAASASATAAAAALTAAGPSPLPEEAVYHRTVARRITAPAGKRVSVAFADAADTARRAAVDRAAALVELGQDLEAISARMREDAEAVRALGGDDDSYGTLPGPARTTTTSVGAALIGDFGSPIKRKPADARPDPVATASATTRIAAAVNRDRRSPRRGRPGAETFDGGSDGKDAGFGATAMDLLSTRDGLSASSSASFPSLLRGGAAAGGARSPRAVSPSRSEREAATEDYVRQHTVGGAPRLNMKAGRAAASAQVFPSTVTMIKPASLGTGGLHARRPDVVASLAAKRENADAAVVGALLSRSSTSALALPPAASLAATASRLGAAHAAEAAVDATLAGGYGDDADDDDGGAGRYDDDEGIDTGDYGPDGSSSSAAVAARGSRAKRRGASGSGGAAAGAGPGARRSAFPTRKEPLQSQRAAAAVAPPEAPGIRSGARLLPSPAELVFKDFTVGQPAVLQVRVTNVALAFNVFQVLELPDVVRDLFTVEHVPPGKMSPGTDVVITVTFLPRRNVDIDTDLTLRSPSGVLRVPLRCRVKRAAPELALHDWREQPVVSAAPLAPADDSIAPDSRGIGSSDAAAVAPIRCDFGTDLHPGATRAQVLRLRNRGALPLSVSLVRRSAGQGSPFAFKDASAVATAQADALTTPIGDAPPGSVPATTAAVGLVPEAPPTFVVDGYSSRSFALVSCANAPGPAVADWELHCDEIGPDGTFDADAGLASTAAGRRTAAVAGAGAGLRRHLGIYSLSLSVGVRDVPIYLPQPLLRFGAITSGREYTACLLVRNRAPQTYRVTASVGRATLSPLLASELAQQPRLLHGSAAADADSRSSAVGDGDTSGGKKETNPASAFAAVPLGELLLEAAASNRLDAAVDGSDGLHDRALAAASATAGVLPVEQQRGIVAVEPPSSYVPPADSGAAAPGSGIAPSTAATTATSPGGQSRGAAATGTSSLSGTVALGAPGTSGVDASLVSDGACGLTIRLAVSREWMAQQRAAWAAQQASSGSGSAAVAADATSTWRVRIPCSLSASGGSASSLSSFRLPFAVEADVSDPLLTLELADNADGSLASLSAASPPGVPDDSSLTAVAVAAESQAAAGAHSLLAIGNVPEGTCVRRLLRVTSHSDLPTTYAIGTAASLTLGDGASPAGTASKVPVPAGALTVVEASVPEAAVSGPGTAPTCGDATVAAMLPMRFLHLAPRESRLVALLFAPTRVGGYAGRLRLTAVEPGVPADESNSMLDFAAEDDDRHGDALAPGDESAALAQRRVASTEIVLPWSARATPRLIYASLSRLLLPPLTGDETAVATVILRHANSGTGGADASATDVAVAWRAESSLPKTPSGVTLSVAPLNGVIAPGGEARLMVTVAAAQGSGRTGPSDAASSAASALMEAVKALDGSTGLRIFACVKPPAAAALSALVAARASITETGDLPHVPKAGVDMSAAAAATAGSAAAVPPHQVLTIPLLAAPPFAREPLFSVSPARQLSVGGVDVGGSRSSSISVTNRTSLPLRVRLRITDPGAGAAFTLPMPLALLRPRESLAVPLLFSPADGRRYACTVLITGRPSDAATVTEAAAGGASAADGSTDAAIGSRTRVTPAVGAGGGDVDGNASDMAVQQSVQVTGFGLLPSLSFMSTADAAAAASAAASAAGSSVAPDAAAALAALQPALRTLAEGVQVLSLNGESAIDDAAAGSSLFLGGSSAVGTATAGGFAPSALRVDFGVMTIGDDAARVVIIANDAPFPVPFAVARLPDSALAIAEAGVPATPAAAAALPMPRLSPACGDPASPWFLSDAVAALQGGEAPSNVANAAATAGPSAAAAAARGAVFALEPSEGTLAAGERRVLRIGLATSSAAASARLLAAAAGAATALRTSAAFAVVVGGGAAAGTAGRTALTAAAASGAGGSASSGGASEAGTSVCAPAVKPLLVTMTALLSDRRVAVLPPEPRLLLAHTRAGAEQGTGATSAATSASVPRMTQLRLPGSSSAAVAVAAAGGSAVAGTGSALPAAGLLREAAFAGSSTSPSPVPSQGTHEREAAAAAVASARAASATAGAAAVAGPPFSATPADPGASAAAAGSLRVCLPPLLLDAALQRPPAAAVALAAGAAAPASAGLGAGVAAGEAGAGADVAGAPSQLALACCDRTAAAASLPLAAALLKGPASAALLAALPPAPFMAASQPPAAAAAAPASASSAKPAPAAAGKGAPAAAGKAAAGAAGAGAGASSSSAAARDLAAALGVAAVTDEAWSQPAPVMLFMLPPSAPVEDDAALLEALLADGAGGGSAGAAAGAAPDAGAGAAAAAAAAAGGGRGKAAPASAGGAATVAAQSRPADPLAGTVLGLALAAVAAAASDEAASAAAAAVAPLMLGARAETAWLSCTSEALQLPTAGAASAAASADAGAAAPPGGKADGKDKAAVAGAAKGGKAAVAAPTTSSGSAGSNCGVLRESLAPGAARCLRFAVPAAAVAPQAISPLAEAHLPWLSVAGIFGGEAANGASTAATAGLAFGDAAAGAGMSVGRVVSAESARHCYGLLVLPPSAGPGSSASTAVAATSAPKLVRIRFSVAP